MKKLHLGLSLAAAVTLVVATAHAETIVKHGTSSSGHNCTVKVEKHGDGSISAVGASGSGSNSAGSISSSTSAGGSSVHVQAGGGSVSSSTTTGGSPGSTSASAGVITVNGCTVTTSSP